MTSQRKGFTIIELLVAITIIGIITAAGVASYTSIQRSTRDARRKADLKAMQTALAQFYSQNGSYPNTNMTYRGTCDNFNDNSPGGNNATTDSGGNGYIPNLAPAFMPRLPRDPREGQPSPTTQDTGSTCYLYISNGQDYKILAHHTVESGYVQTDQFFDPCRPTWAWQVSSSLTARGTNGTNPCTGW